MIDIYINDNIYKVKAYLTIIQACSEVGIDIPRFCYHELLSIAGNCRMCLVEVEKSLKPVASCAMPLTPGMKIYTDSLLVRKAREGVMELLLANHPLDCPICDQGGECDLQDQAIVFGSDRGRFYEYKRAVEDKNIGPLVKMVMTRCIHCTRCVRYSQEIAGVKDLGVTGRGNNMEIGTYISKMLLTTEISGNIIDLCPVGALTSKPFAFTARSWELKNVASIDIFDSLGSNILLCTRGLDVLRVLPLKNKIINEHWISDKVRFNYDGLTRQRLLKPLYKFNNTYLNVSWEFIFSKLLRLIYTGNNQLKGLLGNFVDLETAVLAKDLFNKLGSEDISSKSSVNVGNLDFSFNYKFNSTIVNFDKTDFCVLVGLNIRLELPLLAVRLRKLQNKNGLTVVVIGNTYDYNMDTVIIGNGGKVFLDFIEGRHIICSKFLKAKKPILNIGMNSLNNLKSLSVYSFYKKVFKNTNLISNDWNGLNISTLGNVDVGFFELGLQFNNIDNRFGLNYYKKILYLFGADEFEYNLNNNVIVYQGHHGDIMAGKADIILPSATFIEKNSLYSNIEGRVQKSSLLFTPSGNSRSDWQILNGLLDYLFYSNNNLYNNLAQVRGRLNKVFPFVVNICNFGSLYVSINSYIQLTNVVYNNNNYNYYMTDSISRSSKVMGICSKKINNFVINFNNNLNLAVTTKSLKQERI